MLLFTHAIWRKSDQFHYLENVETDIIFNLERRDGCSYLGKG